MSPRPNQTCDNNEAKQKVIKLMLTNIFSYKPCLNFVEHIKNNIDKSSTNSYYNLDIAAAAY